ncbi:MAG TPA: undecaprenyldiphospho-muramoylpentapeptide beta-N-acetylglucosaminyltransferase [Bacteroidia bacterium]|nr:undecaprenyldiphospho-muramoylpentapeptide beta-N-acetylglucosaminyltransferase [Bacteroidia bacterium]HRH07968.1 undecaprenyldiphospho-muramoylpentapeptide beta-N-acetylglucosaminyltransferase [Bacteroidia bacterium]HRH63664.1 undecaprenyldiphospho-muramoylpentapeptide beta-N-acetylglucosaminyltransferase [Bacteroidia bacterium]
MLKVIISGGGTGGHIFPAIAIANALKEKYNQVEILFVGAEGKMEMEKVPAAGYKIVGLNISGLQRKSILKNISFPFKLFTSVRKSKALIREFKPNVVVGVGGFASGPLLYAATKMGIPALIQEQNSYPGITNKFLAKKAKRICVAYDGMEKYFPKEKIILTGNPVRQDIKNLAGKKERGLEFFGLDASKKTVLVIGGSLGARSINEAIKNCLPEFEKKNIQLIWQTGKPFKAIAEKAVDDYAGSVIRVHDFISKMDYAYAVADVVVSRAGASSVSELCVVDKAAILVPYPLAAEDHQTSNAQALVTHHAAILIKDAEVGEKLSNTLFDLLANDEKRMKLEENILKLAFRDAAEVIASEVASIANSN